MLLKPRFPAVRSRAVSRTDPRPLRRGLSRLRHQGVHCARFHRGTCRRCRTSMDPSSVRTRLWFQFQPAPMVVPTLGTVQLHRSLPGFASSCTRIDNLSMFSPGTQLFRSADGQFTTYPTSQKLSRAGSVQIANALLIELLSSSKYQSLPDSRLVLPPDCYVRAACSDFVSNVNTSGRE